jgi:hypothetical protein
VEEQEGKEKSQDSQENRVVLDVNLKGFNKMTPRKRLEIARQIHQGAIENIQKSE